MSWVSYYSSVFQYVRIIYRKRGSECYYETYHHLIAVQYKLHNILEYNKCVIVLRGVQITLHIALNYILYFKQDIDIDVSQCNDFVICTQFFFKEKKGKKVLKRSIIRD